MNCPHCQRKNLEDAQFCSACGTPLQKTSATGERFTQTLHISMPALDIGGTFAGRYQILEDLGQGGMGRVYKVIDLEIKEQVALKIIKPEIAIDDKMIERFRNELKTARRISHKNVCSMYHLSKDEHGTHYITMEFVPGENLKTVIQKNGPLPAARAVAIARQICEGLAEAHRLGVVHRDLKPQNIMIDADGNARIMDFGIARSTQTQGLTVPASIIGTPEYMSPEQVEGGEADAISDLYSLGVVLYEMVTGRVPFQSDTALGVAVKHKTEIPEEPKNINALVPDALNRIIMTCLKKKKEERFRRAEELREALGAVETELATGKRTKTIPALRPTKTGIFASRRNRIAAAALIIAAVLAAVLLGWKALRAPRAYENFVSLGIDGPASAEQQMELVEFLMRRSLEASTRLNIYLAQDVLVYKKRTEIAAQQAKEPLMDIRIALAPRATDWEIGVALRVRNNSSSRSFLAKGPGDFLTTTIDEIRGFAASPSGGPVGPIPGNRSAARISSSSYDALSHFLKGERAWAKLDSNTAFNEYQTAIEYDANFSLARLKYADVLFFRSDHAGAERNLEQALAGKDGLIETDLLRLQALMARIRSRPGEERRYLRELTEVFPLRKDYHYELAESYFRSGDAEEAIKHYQEALILDPNYALALNHIAYCYAWLGRHDLSEQHFKKYLELDRSANACDSRATGLMFAGKYDEAISVLKQGLEWNPKLDYLYGNMANNQILKGRLREARAALEQEADITQRDITRTNTHFYMAFIEYLKKRNADARRELKPAMDFYSQDAFAGRLDEGPNLPFWLAGILAAQAGDMNGLRENLARLGFKVVMNGVSAANYFPVYKLFIHLKILEAFASKNTDAVVRNIEEGRRIKDKMGLRGSIFNLPFFFSSYADILLRLDRPDDALALLNEVNSYQPSYPLSYILSARAHLSQGNRKDAAGDYARAKDLLSLADPDSALAAEVIQLGRLLGTGIVPLP